MSEERQKALEDAAKAICYLCRDSCLSEFDEVTQEYYHRNEFGQFYNGGFCRANAIRKLT